jgi:hypothetical protein
MFNCYVYWIHLKGQTWNEGYVGVSINPTRRFEEHKSYTDTILAEAIKIHGDDLIYDTIYCGTEISCYELEHKLRPEPYTGWNKARGGRFCPSETLRGIKKSVPVWNKGKKLPRTTEENDHRLKLWQEKMDSGYKHPNRNNIGRPSTKKGKQYPHLHGKIDYTSRSKQWQIVDTNTGNCFTIISLRQWCLDNKFNYNTAGTYARQGKPYKGYQIQ